ncbi:DEAD/DEAH box helicase [Desulfovermiculus halophilus]|uniref:DEAD/DEAH box helicase n=1 Tax=Desulfovermiculus halophilus TaxID=339722 RepID=UPI000688D7F1|nr:DEAD/DEAH box helicase [Desulfovermiculus halophilus]
MKATILKVKDRAELYIQRKDVLRGIKKAMTLDNPQYVQALKYGRFTDHLDPKIHLWEEIEDGIIFPRGWARQCLSMLRRHGIKVEIEDRRRTLESIEMEFWGQLRPYQQQAARAALGREFRVICIPAGGGKTVVCCYLICKTGQPCLIIVHTLELAYQWMDRVKQFLGVDCGLIGDGRFDLKDITISTVQTAAKHTEELKERFGHLVVDEAHHTPASTFTNLVQSFDCRYMTGLTATPFRKDRLGKIIFLTLGDKVYEISAKDLQNSGDVVAPEVHSRTTGFTFCYEDNYPEMLKALTLDASRNEMIANDVANASGPENGMALLLSDRVAHCETLSQLLTDRGVNNRVLTGRTPRAGRQKIVDLVRSGDIDALISTVQLISEGFDVDGLAQLYLCTPMKAKARIIQAIGRVCRPKDGKKARVVDYIDEHVPVLQYQAKSRQRALAEVVA